MCFGAGLSVFCLFKKKEKKEKEEEDATPGKRMKVTYQETGQKKIHHYPSIHSAFFNLFLHMQPGRLGLTSLSLYIVRSVPYVFIA